MITHQYIATTKDFVRYCNHLREDRIEMVAVDIEGEFNLHIYGEHFCLLQIFDGTEAVLVDPYEVEMAEIQGFFEDRDILKITYDAAGDRSLLFKQHGIRMRAILDLKPAVELLPYEKKGLSAVLEKVLKFPPETGKKRFQQYNWTRRPIEPDAIEYALKDVLPLFKLKDALFSRLNREGLMETYIRENLKVQDTDPETDRDPGVLRSGQFRHLSSARQELFRRLFAVRDQYAKRENLPPNDLFSNKDLFAFVRSERPLSSVRPGRRVGRENFSAMLQEMEQLMPPRR